VIVPLKFVLCCDQIATLPPSPLIVASAAMVAPAGNAHAGGIRQRTRAVEIAADQYRAAAGLSGDVDHAVAPRLMAAADDGDRAPVVPGSAPCAFTVPVTFTPPPPPSKITVPFLIATLLA